MLDDKQCKRYIENDNEKYMRAWYSSEKMDRLLTLFIANFLPHVLLLVSSFFSGVHSRKFTIVNQCPNTIWPRMTFPDGTGVPTGFVLNSNESRTMVVPEDWKQGRIWGRTYCSTNASTGRLDCLTGDCLSSTDNSLATRPASPVTIAEFGLNGPSGKDFYDVSIVLGHNLPMFVVPKGGKGNCSSAGCLADLNGSCPPWLRVAHSNGNETIGCKVCDPKRECGRYFKNVCPHVFTYLDDDVESLFTCASADFFVIFCPTSKDASLITGPAVEPSSPPGTGAPGTNSSGFAPRPSVTTPTKSSSNRKIGILIGGTATLVLFITLLGLSWCLRKNGCLQVMQRMCCMYSRKEKEDKDSLLFGYTTIEIATNYFSDESILGRGGYGPVYKGKLLNGQEIAVKRLRQMSGHGIEQFKNEVTVISNLQHRNLVRLLGYCTENNERILIYEYLPNKSLDSIIFNAERRGALGWKSRLQIIEGIGQGLLYLHKYSRLKIIHRDLKTSNILLDNHLNPKISDFGTAKIFGEDELSANTHRIVGTYGYMAPEYAMDGNFSMKSDVFSFGIMMLEIISGKKNTAFYNSDRHINLLAYVWDLWNDGRVPEIIDPMLEETILTDEIVRYVHVGLLCVQTNPNDRPTMSVVLSMLQNLSISLPAPKQPSYAAILSVTNSEVCETIKTASLNMVTISELTAR